MVPQLPPHVGFLLRHCALGTAAGALFLAALVGFDVGGFGELIWRSESPWLVLVVLQLAFTITFGSAAMGSAIFLLPSGPADHDAGAARPAERETPLRPAPVRAFAAAPRRPAGPTRASFLACPRA